MTADEAREMLKRAGLFYYDDGDPPDPEEYPTEEKRKAIGQTLNMNDTWGWATAFGQEITDEELPKVASLFWQYGRCGVLYWVSEKNKSADGEPMRSEFEDINRFVDFVRNEERVAKECHDAGKNLYSYKASYTLPSE